MNSRTFLMAAFLLAVTFGCNSSKSQLSDIDNGVSLRLKSHTVKVQFYDEATVRVTKTDRRKCKQHESLIVKNRELPVLELSKNDDGTCVIVGSDKLLVLIDKATGRVEFLRPDSSMLLSETGIDFTPIEYFGDKGFSVKQGFNFSDNEGIYGLGQHQDGYMNYRGKEVVLVQSNCNSVNPFFVSTSGYGLLWDNYSKTIFNDRNDSTYVWSDMGSNIDYYFFAGNSIDEAISGYRNLTGTAPMYGKWAYGYWQSKEHYDTQYEIDSVATEYRKLELPIDNIVQDWDYWNGTQNWGSMEFDSLIFPEPEKLVDHLHDMNYHFMISIWPAIGPNTKFYEAMRDSGYLYEPVGWGGFRYFDAFNPKANDLYWQYLRKGLYLKGIDAWWMDSTEPDITNSLEKDSHEYESKKVGSNYLGSWARYLNAFSLSMTDAMYNNLRNESDQKRVYILTRSTYAGQQRNGATTWSGDIGANWDIYRTQISAGINHCMSGIPYWTFDIGAFLLGSYGGVFYEGGKTAAYEEFYTRMFQFGAFCPIFRSHGSNQPREIYSMNNYRDVLVKYDNLRYRLLPYIYSQAWKVTSQNYTYMRGLPMDFANDTATYGIDDQYMFGPSIMVCPVTDYMYNEPPCQTELVPASCFRAANGSVGLDAKYYSDKDYKNMSYQSIDSTISLYWYSGRPAYATDSMYSVVWTGKLIPAESGKHQFHVKTFDGFSLSIDGNSIETAVAYNEKYLVPINLEAGKEYDIEVRTSNNQTGAARMLLNWKTPSKFAQEGKIVDKVKTRKVYLPNGKNWFDFWTGEAYTGGQIVEADASIEIMPLFVTAGSIIPMGPFLQYATEKQPDPIELRIYPGADGSFVLYEDENDNYNYEKGQFQTIDIEWNDALGQLTIGNRKGGYPGMMTSRTFNVTVVDKGNGVGVEVSKITKSVKYNGQEVVVDFDEK